jgi:hypothetical protein
MGAWGIGLYSNDFAMDLRGCIDAVVRLPFDADRLLETIRLSEPASADDPADPDHTVFWLTAADRLAAKGVDCPAAREKALAIIDGGADLATMASLGMDERSLRKRKAMLESLRLRLIEPVATGKRRGVLKGPQKLLLEVGEALTYPVSCKDRSCEPINPYAVGKEWEWVKAWNLNGWGAVVVVERGLLFDFLAWYRPLAAWQAMTSEPTLTDLAAPRAWRLQQAGTLTARHYANLQLKSLGRVEIDPSRLSHFLPDRRQPVGSVVSDISIANGMNCHAEAPEGEFWDMTTETIRPGLRALSDIAPGGEAANGLSGPWTGEYSEDGEEAPPRTFRLALTEMAGLARGEMAEAATPADKPGRPLEAAVEGRRAGRAVRLIKRYVSATKRYIPILYEGQVNEAGDRIEGRWSMRAGRAGRFVMQRADGGAPELRPAPAQGSSSKNR